MLILLLSFAGYCFSVEINFDGGKLDTTDLSKLRNLLQKLPEKVQCERYWLAVRESYQPVGSNLGNPEPSLFENLAQKVLAQGNKVLASYLSNCAVTLGGSGAPEEPMVVSVGTGNASPPGPVPVLVEAAETLAPSTLPASTQLEVENGPEMCALEVSLLKAALVNYEAQLEKLRQQLASARKTQSDESEQARRPIVNQLSGPQSLG